MQLDFGRGESIHASNRTLCAHDNLPHPPPYASVRQGSCPGGKTSMDFSTVQGLIEISAYEGLRPIVSDAGEGWNKDLRSDCATSRFTTRPGSGRDGWSRLSLNC